MAPAEMPQPLSSKFPGEARPQFWVGATALARYPSLAAKVMEVLGTWSSIDAIMIGIVTQNFTKHDYGVVVAMLNAISGSEARKAAIRGAAQDALSKPDFELFNAVESSINSSRNRRNEYAHGLWGYCEQFSFDHLLLIKPRHFQSHIAKRAATRQLQDSGTDTLFDLKLIQVYEDSDIERDREDAHECFFLVRRLELALSNDFEADQARRELSTDPRIQRKIDKSPSPP